MKKITLLALFLAFCGLSTLGAVDKPVVKIDFNEPSRTNMLEVLEPGYTPWPVPKDCQSASLEVDGVKFTVESEHIMRVGWNKALVQTAVENVRLTGDGLNLDPKTTDGSLFLKIEGLPAGSHSIKTYHNSWQDPSRFYGWPIIVYCNGDSVARIERTMQKTLAEAAASVTTSFTVENAATVTVLEFRTTLDDYDEETGGKNEYDVTPVLNGFELNTANIKLHWPMNTNLNGAGEKALLQAFTAEITDRDVPAPFLFATTVTKAGHLDWNDAQEVCGEYEDDVMMMCKLKTNAAATGSADDALDFVFTPQHAVRYLPKVLHMSLAFNDQSAEEFIVVELLNGDDCCPIDTVYATLPARQRQDLEYLLYTKGCTEYLDGTSRLRLRLHAPQSGTKFFVGGISLSGDGTEPDQKVYLAGTKVSPKVEYGRVEPASRYFLLGDTVTFEALAADGYKFKQWEYDGYVISMDNPLVCDALAGDTLMVAVFETAQSYTLDCTAQGEGCRVRISPEGETKEGRQWYQDGTKVTLTAYGTEGLYFSHWQDEEGRVVAKTNPARVVMNRNYDLTAVFTEEEHIPLRAFPTAEGYGRNATGGRGGAVVEVTNLSSDASVEGSLLWALKQYPGQPLTVVFRVSGTIESDDRYITLGRSNVTYAGQTAPGDGICFRKAKVKLNGNNVIMRNLRFRVGDELGQSLSAIGIENFHHVIIDHCSISWSTEENVTMYDNDSTTMQYCIVSEPLYNSNNYKGARAYASQWGGEPASYLHNLLAHAKTRAPRFNGSSKNDYHAFVDVRNNVMYNCGDSYGGEIRGGGVSCFNQLVANYYRKGPASGNYFVSPSSPYGQWYIADNYMEYNDEANRDNWKAVNVNAGVVDDIRSEQPGDDFMVFTETAEEAYRSVLDGAGAFPRDTIDRRIINEAAGLVEPTVIASYGVAGIIDTPSEAGGWPVYRSAEAPADSDHDGMPDEWERANGLNPNDPSDRNTVTRSGYTCLEVYLNGLMGEKIQLSFPGTALNSATEARPGCWYNTETQVLHINGGKAVCAVSVISMDGRTCSREQGTDVRQMDLSSLPRGGYVVRMTMGGGQVFTEKMIKF